jgi:DNA-binding NtrC family response regulator
MDGMLAAARGGPVRILLVEDHPDTLDLLSRVLRMEGHDVVAADGFQAALRLAETAEFQLMVADIQLGDGCGWALMEHMQRRRPGLAGIAMTGHGQVEHRERSVQAGYRAHLTKPIDFGKLREAIRRCVDGLR